MIVNNIYDLVGKTPVVKLNNIVDESMAEVYLKLEAFNPGGSVKDRIALNMIEAFEEKGELKKGDTIVESTSGNTGIGIAMIGAAKGYKVVITMPESMSIERRKTLTAYGAEIVLTDATKGMKGANDKAMELVESNGYKILRQFENAENPIAHIKHTSQEIIADFKSLDAFVSGVGTGGTITGNSKVLKDHYQDIEIIAVEPSESSVLSGNNPGPHRIQGIGAGFIPEILDTTSYTGIEKVTTDDAIAMMKRLSKEEGILAGISTGAALTAGLRTAKRLGKNHKVLVIAPDTGERYLSMDL